MGVGKLSRSKLGLGKLGFGKVGRLGGKLSKHDKQRRVSQSRPANNVPVISYVLLSYCSINVFVWSNAQVAN